MKQIDYEEAVRAAGALAALMGVPAASLVAEIVAPIAGRLGCAIVGCDASDDKPHDPSTLPDLAPRYDDAMREMEREAAGISKR
jgi:hypothetical protein